MISCYLTSLSLCYSCIYVFSLIMMERTSLALDGTAASHNFTSPLASSLGLPLSLTTSVSSSNLTHKSPPRGSTCLAYRSCPALTPLCASVAFAGTVAISGVIPKSQTQTQALFRQRRRVVQVRFGPEAEAWVGLPTLPQGVYSLLGSRFVSACRWYSIT
ncbi:hypothetical protein PAXRUDRAFT_378977 [Paxillus rubicundulus Ve08.2h10]|uniref:Uncharacterized protein n=1 Tax=Paxillus rubicundulus Ve08.2h10 TaxID=930991 RepID=A0A0D0DRD5_9AGAM|nr:hypothetical protein PAXRUDRAFT_378977 [Paxillus rubicundulus Ve08.2h10]